MAVTSLRGEVTDLLSRLIRIDTTNPPGNEAAAAELLRECLEASRVECEFYARVPERVESFDSHWLREAFCTVAYGFFPDLELGLDWLRFAARAVCG